MHRLEYKSFKDNLVRNHTKPFPFNLIVILKKIHHLRSYELAIDVVMGNDNQIVLLSTQLEESDFKKYKYCIEKISGFEKMDYGKKAIAYVYTVNSIHELDAIYANCVNSLERVEFSEFL